MCIPSSAISKSSCRSGQQIATTAHQIARTATSFGVSEIIVYNTEEKPSAVTSSAGNAPVPSNKPKKIVFGEENDDLDEPESTKNAAEEASEDIELSDQDKLVGFLEYFVTPSYLRKSLFGNKLHLFDGPARRLPKLTGLPYLNHSSSRYFVGLSVQRKIPGRKQRKTVSANGRIRKKKPKAKNTNPQETDPTITGYVNIGEKKLFKLAEDVKVPVNSIVVVDKETATIVSPEQAFGPKPQKDSNKNDTSQFQTSNANWTKDGFAYKVRKVESFGKVFTDCPFPSGYRYTALAPCLEYFEDATGTSMEGSKLKKATDQALAEIPLIEEETFLIKGITTTPGDEVPVLLVLGKWTELERSVLADREVLGALDKAQMIFDGRVRMGRGARVEDALLIALAKIEGL